MTVTSVSVSGLKDALSEFLNRAAYGRERIIVASRGKPKAAIIGIDDLRRLEELEEEWEAAMLTEAIATETDFYSVTEVEAELAALEPAR
jgi:prevent-host-death family protein